MHLCAAFAHFADRQKLTEVNRATWTTLRKELTQFLADAAAWQEQLFVDHRYARNSGPLVKVAPGFSVPKILGLPISTIDVQKYNPYAGLPA
jgi:hypothetical protein